MVTIERRRAPRTKLRELVYIGMGSDNGGVVLDISDGGLSFHAVASVPRDTPIHFSLTINGRRRVEGLAEVAWNSAAGKCAGLRFTHLPEEVREQIQIWSNQPRLNSPAAVEDLQMVEMKSGQIASQIPAPVAVNTSLSPEAVERVPNPSVVSPECAAKTEAASPELEGEGHPAARRRPNPLSMFPPEPFGESGAAAHAPRYTVPSKHGVFAIAFTVILAFIIAIGGLSYAYLHGAGKYLIELGEKIWGWF